MPDADAIIGQYSWRIVTNSENANRSETVPATALLFQAPQFLEPTPPRSTRHFDTEGTNQTSVSEREGSRRRWTKNEATELTDGAKEVKKSESSPESKNRHKDSAHSHKRHSEPFASHSSNEISKQVGSTGENRDREDGKEREQRERVVRTRSAENQAKKESKTRLTRPQSVAETEQAKSDDDAALEETTRRRRRRSRSQDLGETAAIDSTSPSADDGVQALKGSTRLEAKRIRRRETRRERRRRYSITEAEFLARRESVNRQMVVRHRDGLNQIAVLEDGILVEHYVANKTQQSIVGNVYLGRVHNVLPSMEAAFVDIGRGRNAVLYAGEVNWSALGVGGTTPRRIESALKPGDTVLVQVTKDAIGHKGARLTAQISLAGRYLVLVPGSSTLGISRKLPDAERMRLKKLLRQSLPENAGVIVRTAAEGASEEQLLADIERLSKQWAHIQQKQKTTKKAPTLLRSEPELVVRVVRDIFNEDFSKLIVQGKETWDTVSKYVNDLSPELSDRLEYWTGTDDLFHDKRIDQQLTKGMDRKVWLPSGGTLIIDRTEAMTVIDVNTGKFIGSGGTLEETVTRNNLEAAEEIVRQLRLRDIGGMIIVDFVDMVLESNRELVLRRLIECLTRDRTRHQVTEVTSLGLVQMTRKRVGEGLVEAFSTPCEHCEGRGFIVHNQPVELMAASVTRRKERHSGNHGERQSDRGHGHNRESRERNSRVQVTHSDDEQAKSAVSAIAAASEKAEVDSAKKTGKDARKKRRRVVSAGTNAPATTVQTQIISQELSEIALPKAASESQVPAAPAISVDDIVLPESSASSKPARKRRRVVVSAEVVAPATAPTSAEETTTPSDSTTENE